MAFSTSRDKGKSQSAPQSEPSEAERIAQQIMLTSTGAGFYGGALQAALDCPAIAKKEHRAALMRFLSGQARGMDSILLQEVAHLIRVHGLHWRPTSRLCQELWQKLQSNADTKMSLVKLCGDKSVHFKVEFIQDCIQELDHRIADAQPNGLNPLERLAMQLLLNAAGMYNVRGASTVAAAKSEGVNSCQGGSG